MKINENRLIYRKVDSTEIPLIVDYRIMFLKEIQGDQPIEKEKRLRKRLTDYFQKALNDNLYIGWVAEYDEKPVGFGGMVIQIIPGHFKYINGLKGYILNMYTIPEYRHNGICGNILKKLIENGKELGLNSIYLHATDEGIDLYRKEGFTESDWPVLELSMSE
ncbi:MAG: GNAT family N-acetyltransferase [Ignavibacteria bacterium]|jgi:ribosomal protein S18 acetylase RimI-like enzyme